MGFNSAFKGLKVLKPRERAFKQFKWPRPQCVNVHSEKQLEGPQTRWPWFILNLGIP